MKKVLSVLLAAAMVMGMSVSAMADATFGKGSATAPATQMGTVDFDRVLVSRDGVVTPLGLADIAAAETDTLEAGDILYFNIKHNGADIAAAPSNWVIKINNADYVAGAAFVEVDGSKTNNALNKAWNALGYYSKATWVKVELESDFDHFEEDEVKFYFYVYDTKFDVESERVKVAYDFSGYNKETLTKDKLNWVVTVDEPTIYTYAKGEKAAKATIDFDGQAYTEFKMYAEEKYTLSSEAKYNKALSKELDTDVEVITFRMGNVENFDILFPAAKDNKQIVAVVDGELVPVEATYVEDHKFQSGKKADGYLVEDAEYLNYAVIDADVEIEVEAEVEAPVEADKANPETGAADFVGAAVAMAVVSVAAAGALALKK